MIMITTRLMNTPSDFKIALVTGGCKSGKSNQALAMAKDIQVMPDAPRYFLATCIPADEELEQRVQAHQNTRGKGWHTIEAPYDLPHAMVTHSPRAVVMVVDCLTMWISNLLCAPETSQTLDTAFEALGEALTRVACPVVLVSNEVGCGIVPENALARRFRDLAGNLNQQVAGLADCVVWCVSGIPVRIK